MGLESSPTVALELADSCLRPTFCSLFWAEEVTGLRSRSVEQPGRAAMPAGEDCGPGDVIG